MEREIDQANRHHAEGITLWIPGTGHQGRTNRSPHFEAALACYNGSTPGSDERLGQAHSVGKCKDRDPRKIIKGFGNVYCNAHEGITMEEGLFKLKLQSPPH